MNLLDDTIVFEECARDEKGVLKVDLDLLVVAVVGKFSVAFSVR